MSINATEYKISLERIASALRSLGGSEAASVQINTNRTCILRSRIHGGEHLSIEEFAHELDIAVDADLEAGWVQSNDCPEIDSPLRDIEEEIEQFIDTGPRQMDVEKFILERVRSHPKQATKLLLDYFHREPE